jgi:hypothetical protein
MILSILLSTIVVVFVVAFCNFIVKKKQPNARQFNLLMWWGALPLSISLITIIWIKFYFFPKYFGGIPGVNQ